MKIIKRIEKLKEKLEEYMQADIPTSNCKRQATKLRNKIHSLELRLENHRNCAMKNRVDGTRLEFKLLKKEKRNSLIAIRSAGSHSLIDLFSIKKNGTIVLMTVKRDGNWSPREMKKLRELKKQLPSNCVIKKVFYRNKKHHKVTSLK